MAKMAKNRITEVPVMDIDAETMRRIQNGRFGNAPDSDEDEGDSEEITVSLEISLPSSVTGVKSEGYIASAIAPNPNPVILAKVTAELLGKLISQIYPEQNIRVNTSTSVHSDSPERQAALQRHLDLITGNSSERRVESEVRAGNDPSEGMVACE